MRTSWIAFALAAAVVAGCQPSEEQQQASKMAERQKVWSSIEADKAELDKQRAALAELEAQAAAGTATAEQVAAADAAVTAASDAFSSRLATYINDDPPVQGEPMRPDQLAAMRLNSAEGMLVAREYIERGGDYRRAIDIYNQLLGADPDNADLQAAKADAESKRFMTAECLATVSKGMGEADVLAALGRPLSRNMKEYPEKKVTAWFYPTDESGNAAGVFFNDKMVVYDVKIDAVKTEAPGA